METQNITLALPKKTLVRIKVIAAQQQTSVSALVTKALTQLAEQEEAYSRARRRHLRQLENVADLGTHGRITAAREDLHERR